MSSKIHTHGNSEHKTHEASVVEAQIESNRRFGVYMPIVAMAVAIVISTSVVLLVYPNLGVVASSGASSANVAPTSGLIISMEVKDGNGKLIPMGGVSESDTITFSGYYSGGYTLDLVCTIDSFPAYCDSSPIAITGLPSGTHTLTIEEPGTSLLSFTWIVG